MCITRTESEEQFQNMDSECVDTDYDIPECPPEHTYKCLINDSLDCSMT